MIYKLQNGGIMKLQKAGLVPKIKTLLQNVAKATPKTLDSNIKEVPKIIQHVPRVTISEPYARLSRDGKIINEARSFSIDGDPFNTFQLIKDVEPNQYSIHFKTLGRNALSEPQKQMLFQAIADAIPGGSTLSTWGSVSKGGLAGLKRFERLGFKPTLQTRTLGLKMQPTVGEVFPFGELVADKVEVPILYKPKEVVAGSKPISIAEKAGIPKGERPYLVDWTNWSKSTPISEKHLIEYSIINNDLWRSKFKPFAGTDIRSHIQLRSKDAKKLDPRILFTGVEETIDPNYNGILWTTRDGLSARAYAPSDDKVMQIVIPKDAKINTYDANSNGWFEIDGKKMWDKGYRTNDFVNQSFDNGYDIAEIKRVIDIGPNYVPYSSKYNYFDNKLDFLERAPIQTDVVIKPEFPRKSIIGNNGDFDLSKQSLFEKQGGKI